MPLDYENTRRWPGDVHVWSGLGYMSVAEMHGS